MAEIAVELERVSLALKKRVISKSALVGAAPTTEEVTTKAEPVAKPVGRSYPRYVLRLVATIAIVVPFSLGVGWLLYRNSFREESVEGQGNSREVMDGTTVESGSVRRVREPSRSFRVDATNRQN